MEKHQVFLPIMYKQAHISFFVELCNPVFRYYIDV